MKQFPTAFSVLITIAALACLQLVPPTYASEKSVLESKVDAFLKVGDYDRAFKLVDSFLQEQSDTPIGHTMLERVITEGSGFLNAADRKRALKLIDGYIQEFPAKPIGRAMMVRVLAADGQTDRAFTEYYRFYKLSETNSPELLMEIVRGALNHSNKAVRAIAAESVQNMRDKGAVPALINAFREMRDPYKVNNLHLLLSVTSALGTFGDKQATPVLIDGLKNRDVEARISAASALGRLGDKDAVPHLIIALNKGNDGERDDYFQDSVVEALGELGDKRASSVLLKALHVSESFSKVRVALALAKVGNGVYKEHAIFALMEILNDDGSTAQRRAGKALAELGDERGVIALIDALNNNINVSRGSAAQIQLGENGDKRAIPYLIGILNGRYNNFVRAKVARVLGMLGDDRAISALASALSNDGTTWSMDGNLNEFDMLTGEHFRVHAAKALAKLGDARGIPHLISAFNSSNEDIKGYAAVALAELGDASIAPKLVEILGGDESIGLKFWAAEALVKLSR